MQTPHWLLVTKFALMKFAHFAATSEQKYTRYDQSLSQDYVGQSLLNELDNHFFHPYFETERLPFSNNLSIKFIGSENFTRQDIKYDLHEYARSLRTLTGLTFEVQHKSLQTVIDIGNITANADLVSALRANKEEIWAGLIKFYDDARVAQLTSSQVTPAEAREMEQRMRQGEHIHPQIRLELDREQTTDGGTLPVELSRAR